MKRYSVSPEVAQQLLKRFTHHPPIGDQVDRYGQLRSKALELALLVAGLTPVSREQSLSLTKIEEAVMHANSAIARNENPASFTITAKAGDGILPEGGKSTT